MNYQSILDTSHKVSFKEAVLRGQAPNKGLYLPESIPTLSPEELEEMKKMSFQGISFLIAKKFIGSEISSEKLQEIIERAINFDAPLKHIYNQIYCLELFQGPSLAFKDFGARFMAGIISHFIADTSSKLTILVATSGDTGSAVAQGFLDCPSIDVVLLYPSGKISLIQEMQLACNQGNVQALEVAGTFDDCQSLVKEAFSDQELRAKINLSSANSINIARLIPQCFYYFWAWRQLEKFDSKLVFSVPSGNFGNLSAGLIAYKMGLPVDKFIAATNINDTVPIFLEQGEFKPKASRQTISNAMDVGNPSNFYRLSKLFEDSHPAIKEKIVGYSISEEETREKIRSCYNQHSYILDPHSAIGLAALEKYFDSLEPSSQDCYGIFLATAHPAKFLDIVEAEIDTKIEIPKRLQVFLDREKQSIKIDANYQDFKNFLLSKTLE